MIPHDPMRLYRLHEEQLTRDVERRRRQREFLAERARERRSDRAAMRLERRTRRAAARAAGGLLALLLPARRG